jgi:hypothetical protein
MQSRLTIVYADSSPHNTPFGCLSGFLNSKNPYISLVLSIWIPHKHHIGCLCGILSVYYPYLDVYVET